MMFYYLNVMDKKIIKYGTVGEQQLLKLEERVNNAIAVGWQPYGALNTVATSTDKATGCYLSKQWLCMNRITFKRMRTGILNRFKTHIPFETPEKLGV